ncbi:NAD(P)/FAD-dependent oxidoreductase [Fredinandcohnia sp. 179-A 10B2 NHS]|uniref:NAD(P)/FAD-dependent oxidoreductase n=1 Tax=Fredinandcohnia sp. 179-A 10B2 NHS TaxID=3235176 RepID=UPI0039A00FC8
MTDVVIIGAGPAGLSAAITCAEHGLKARVIDEFIKPGGRLLGQLHQEPNGDWWNGIDEANKLLQRACELGIQINTGTPVHHLQKIDSGWMIHTSNEIIETPRVLLATGAAEHPSPIPGWTLPGVMSIGAAQVMTNVHRVKVGQNGIIIGVNILGTAIARELKLAGISISSMVLPPLHNLSKDSGDPEKVFESLLRVSHLAPSPFIRIGSRLMKTEWLKRLGISFYPKTGVKMWNIPVQIRKAATRIIGKDQVEGVEVVNVSTKGEPIKGTERIIPVDFVCIAGGLYPLAELAAVSGCPFHYIKELGGHIPLHNERMETPVDGLYVAGNITGIESAKVAMKQGIVAGYSIIHSTGTVEVNHLLQNAIEDVNNTRKNATIQFHPNILEGRKKIQKYWVEFHKVEKSS